jgi:hypothetical protein
MVHSNYEIRLFGAPPFGVAILGLLSPTTPVLAAGVCTVIHLEMIETDTKVRESASGREREEDNAQPKDGKST